MEKSITILLGLMIGSIIISGLILNEIGLIKPILMLITSIVFFIIFYIAFIDKKFRLNKYEIVLLILTVLIGVLMVSLSKFPFSDFWWYHQKNWFIVNHVLDTGKIINWVPFWHLGYPLLQMYGPGSHILSVFFAEIFGLNIFFGGVIVNILTYVFLILSINLFLRKYSNSIIAFVASAIVPISPRLFNEIFIQGHYPNMLALSFGLIGLTYLESKDRKGLILFTLFMLLSLLTHFSFFMILAIATLFTFVIMGRLKDYKILARFGIPVLLGSFWLLPAIIESNFWHGTIPGPSPFIIYLLSFGPFLILILGGLYLMFKENYNYLFAFIISLIIISFIPIALFPILPDGLSSLLQKIFVDTFKSTITASIFMVIPLAVFFIYTIKNIKYRKWGTLFLILFVAFAFFLDYVYVRQDAIDIISFKGDYYRDNEYTRLHINNFEAINEVIDNKDAIYDIDPLFGPQLFNINVVGGLPIPAPRRNLELHQEEYVENIESKGIRLSVSSERKSQEDYRRANVLGYYDYVEYDFSPRFIKNIREDGNILEYIAKPENFPSGVTENELTIYWAKEGGNLVHVGDKKLDYELDVGKIEVNTRKPEFDINVDIGINYSPHWKAYVDGNKTDIKRTDDDTIKVTVPAGVKELELLWENTIYNWIGIAISLLTLAGLIFAFLSRD